MLPLRTGRRRRDRGRAGGELQNYGRVVEGGPTLLCPLSSAAWPRSLMVRPFLALFSLVLGGDPFFERELILLCEVLVNCFYWKARKKLGITWPCSGSVPDTALNRAVCLLRKSGRVGTADHLLTGLVWRSGRPLQAGRSCAFGLAQASLQGLRAAACLHCLWPPWKAGLQSWR